MGAIMNHGHWRYDGSLSLIGSEATQSGSKCRVNSLLLGRDFQYRRKSLGIASHLSAVLLCVTAFLSFLPQARSQDADGSTDPNSYESLRDLNDHVLFDGIAPKLYPGDSKEAIGYYAAVGAELGLKLVESGSPASFTLDDLLAYLGLTQFSAMDLETKSSADLMKPFSSDELLAIRYFAPKIADVSSDEPVEFGWRKLVQWKVAPGSEADKHHVAEAYILFNFFTKTAAEDPFSGAVISGSNQVILVPKADSSDRPILRWPAYWLVFDKRDSIGKSKLGLALDGTFDAGHVAGKSRPYYLPRACAECHGGSVAAGRLNFVDTDYVFDRVTPPFGYFAEAFKAPKAQPVLFDCGSDPKNSKFETGFEVIRKVNKQILNQNEMADREAFAKSFQTQGAKAWKKLHANRNSDDLRHAAPAERALQTRATDAKWKVDSPEDRKALSLLIEHCYRCHSSIKYSIFDKEAVKNNFVQIVERVLLPASPTSDVGAVNRRRMPQDRILNDLQRAELLTALYAALK